MNVNFSFIIPVFNRPDEIRELLESLTHLEYTKEYEIVIVEDGSTLPCLNVINDYNDILRVSYYSKANTGPGPSRNYGMSRASGNFFIVLDSDCLVPPQYLCVVENELKKKYVDFYGGPDSAMDSFSDIQKAINYTMTSVFTTGGIRGGTNGVDKFQPRSFNMGISKKTFEKSNGFGRIHPGEDPDLVLRLWKMNFKSRLFPEAFVYHKRRLSWSKFFKQVNKFGMVRPILNSWHEGSGKFTYWFPTFFCFGLLLSIILILLGIFVPAIFYCVYLCIIFIDAVLKTGKLKIGFLAIIALFIQFIGYGYGFFKVTLFVSWLKRNPQEKFPKLFFD